MWLRCFLLVSAWALAACGDDDAMPARVDGGASRIDSAAPPMDRCRSGAGWDSAAPAFVDATAAWGLEGLDGNTLAVGDLDGDGWPDLIAMGGPSPDPMTTQR